MNVFVETMIRFGDTYKNICKNFTYWLLLRLFAKI